MVEMTLRGRSEMAPPHKSCTTARCAAKTCGCAVQQQQMD
jgi:hypothetical protein